MTVAGQILVFLWLLLILPGLVLGFAWFGFEGMMSGLQEPLTWVMLLFPLLGVYLWRKAKQLEISPEELKKYR